MTDGWTSRCRVCGRVLENPASQKAGIGPVCLAKETARAVERHNAWLRSQDPDRTLDEPVVRAGTAGATIPASGLPRGSDSTYQTGERDAQSEGRQ